MPEAPYFIGAANTSECPGSTQIDDEGACKTATASLGIVWNISGAWFSSPRRCFVGHTGYGYMGYFNTHANGSANLGQYPICKAYTSNLPMKGIGLRV